MRQVACWHADRLKECEPLPNGSNVQQQVTKLLRGDEGLANERISDSPDHWRVDGEWVEVNSPVELHIVDELGNHLGPTPQGGIEYGIRNAQYDVMDHDKSAFVPKGIRYTAVLTGTDNGEFDLRLREVQGGVVIETVLFKDVPVNTDTVAVVSLESVGNYTLSIDRDGNGTIDSAIAPTAILNSTDSLDITPPNTVINVDGEIGLNPADQVTISLMAADNVGGSGLQRIEYTLDGDATVKTYTEPFVVSPRDVPFIFVRAVDKAGNEEGLIIKQIGPVQIYLPLINR
jgi:hypothetical protein